ncbi:MAG: hypothetical protein KGZ89_06875 [Actinobacteria bacterium]|nr:hypothetical protein [Actinomycetota bacterium]
MVAHRLCHRAEALGNPALALRVGDGSNQGIQRFALSNLHVGLQRVVGSPVQCMRSGSSSISKRVAIRKAALAAYQPLEGI